MKQRLYKGEEPHEVIYFTIGGKVYYHIVADKKYDAEIAKALLEDCRIFKLTRRILK